MRFITSVTGRNYATKLFSYLDVIEYCNSDNNSVFCE